ncbi:unannotated protein [freshwater metagenome]|uniref:Unannotated protein n=1 Tax=freshwater metagenome TaxID=449393 RepID=A0A6J7JLA9_9ZZZZ|nr:polyprenyl synthetase family protein [Actinomycetota bacterium]
MPLDKTTANPRERQATPKLPPSLLEAGAAAEARVVALLTEEIERWSGIDANLREPIEALKNLVIAGGKRLRPAFCHWSFIGAGGSPDDAAMIDAGAALELLHSFALIHDDVMDGSDRRRDLPAVHRHFMNRHSEALWNGEERRFGEGAAILIGDFAFVYADRLMAGCSPTTREIYNELRLELCVGQYLDLLGTAAGERNAERARRIEWYKSGKYTVERPLHLGAALAGRYDELAEDLSAFGLPLGEAFQMRDDILGVFGDAAVTGKPVGDDLREGKLTPLIAYASERADASQAKLLDRVGAPDLHDEEIELLSALLIETGAVDAAEASIKRLVAESMEALSQVDITEEARHALGELGLFVAWRDR